MVVNAPITLPSQLVHCSFIVLSDLYRTRGEFHELMRHVFIDLCKANKPQYSNCSATSALPHWNSFSPA